MKHLSMIMIFFGLQALNPLAAFPAPEVVAPIGEVTRQNGQVQFEWQPVPNVTRYELEAYPLDAQGGIVWESILGLGVTPQQAGCSNGGLCRITQAVAVEASVWKIRAISTQGERSNYTEYQTFMISSVESPIVIPIFSTPEIVSPTGSSTRENGLVSFEWQAVSNVERYELGAYPQDAQGNIIWESIFDLGITPQQAGCSNGGSCRIRQAVNVGAAIWKMRAVSIQGERSNYTEYTAFTLSGSTPTSYPPPYFPDPVSYFNWLAAPQLSVSAPGFLDFIIDGDTGKPVWRLGGSPQEMGNALPHPNANGAITSLHAQHFYSRTAPTNKDESYAISASRNSYAALWKLSSKQLVAWIPTAATADNQQQQILWDKNHNNVFWYTEGNKLLRAEIDFAAYAVSRQVWDSFTEYRYITFGSGEGDFSDDGKKIVLAGKSYNSNNFTIISYLVNTKTHLASKTVPAANGRILDWAGVDPTGEYVVYNRPAQGSSMWVLPFNLSGSPRLLYRHMKHSDFVVDKQGEAWLVLGHWQGVFATKLASPELKRVWPTAVEAGNPADYPKVVIPTITVETASGHISRVSGLPGVVLMARNVDGGLYYINIDEVEKTIYVGNTRHGRRPDNDPSPKQAWGVDKDGGTVSSDGGKDYLREPRASASQSGKYIFFVSDYHVHGTTYDSNPLPEFKAYLNMIQLQP